MFCFSKFFNSTYLQDSFIVDNGPFHIWVWIGRQASTKERVEAMRNAHGFLKKKNYPKDCRISRVVDGGEPIEFKVLFASWMEREKISTTVSKTNVNGNDFFLVRILSFQS